MSWRTVLSRLRDTQTRDRAPLRTLLRLPGRWLRKLAPMGHEPEPAGVRSGLILALLFGWCVFLALSLGALHWVVSRALHPAPASQQVSAFPEPRLQTDARADLERLIAAQSERLGQTRWIDRDAGRVQIPIGRAMDLVAGMGERAFEPLEAGAPDDARGIAVGAATRTGGAAP